MVTNNWIKLFNMTWTYTYADESEIGLVLINGNAPSHYRSYNNRDYFNFNISNMSNVDTNFSYMGYCGFLFGDGTNPPSADDYKLAGADITLNLEKLSAEKTCGYNSETKKSYITYNFIMKNTSSADVTIREIGYYACYDGNAENLRVLLDRTLLDTPITIPAGSIGQVVYTINFNYPTATA